MKVVRYNGGTGSYYGCSDPSELVIGKEYEVTSVTDRGWQTDYTLINVNGHFNSVWFDEVVTTEQKVKTFLAFGYETPIVGRRYDCFKLDFKGGPKSIFWNTSPVKEVFDMGDNIYRVLTCNSTYIVKIVSNCW